MNAEEVTANAGAAVMWPATMGSKKVLRLGRLAGDLNMLGAVPPATPAARVRIIRSQNSQSVVFVNPDILELDPRGGFRAVDEVE